MTECYAYAVTHKGTVICQINHALFCCCWLLGCEAELRAAYWLRCLPSWKKHSSTVNPEGGGSVGAQLAFLLATHTPTHTVAGSMAPVDLSTVSRRIILVAEEKQK